MSKETLSYLNLNTLIGYTEKRGTAWHYREDLQGDRPNHFEGPVPVERAIELLDYPLVKARITATAEFEDGTTLSLEDPERVAIMRPDRQKLFGIFKDRSYKIHHPKEWVMDNVNLLLDGGLNIGSVVSLGDGAVVALQAELEDTREAPNGITHRPFLTAATSHDGSLATTYKVGTTVVVCDNTLSIALGESSPVHKVRHSTNSLARVGEIRERLGLVVEQVGDAFDEQVKKLTSEYVSDERWADFVKAYTNPTGKELEGRSKTIVENRAAALDQMWFYDERVAPWKNNAWGVVSAVNTAAHHTLPVKGATRPARNMQRMVMGEWDKIDAKTLKVLAKV